MFYCMKNACNLDKVQPQESKMECKFIALPEKGGQRSGVCSRVEAEEWAKNHLSQRGGQGIVFICETVAVVQATIPPFEIKDIP